MLKLLPLFIFLFLSTKAFGSHVMGGEITWKCDGNNKYIFELVFYRDCNGAEVNTLSEALRVWNHPTLTTIILPFVSRIDISPVCTTVAGGPLPLDCGTGTSGWLQISERFSLFGSKWEKEQVEKRLGRKL